MIYLNFLCDYIKMVYECLIFEQQLLTKRYLILFHLLSLMLLLLLLL